MLREIIILVTGDSHAKHIVQSILNQHDTSANTNTNISVKHHTGNNLIIHLCWGTEIHTRTITPTLRPNQFNIAQIMNHYKHIDVLCISGGGNDEDSYECRPEFIATAISVLIMDTYRDYNTPTFFITIIKRTKNRTQKPLEQTNAEIQDIMKKVTHKTSTLPYNPIIPLPEIQLLPDGVHCTPKTYKQIWDNACDHINNELAHLYPGFRTKQSITTQSITTLAHTTSHTQPNTTSAQTVAPTQKQPSKQCAPTHMAHTSKPSQPQTLPQETKQTHIPNPHYNQLYNRPITPRPPLPPRFPNLPHNHPMNQPIQDQPYWRAGPTPPETPSNIRLKLMPTFTPNIMDEPIPKLQEPLPYIPSRTPNIMDEPIPILQEPLKPSKTQVAQNSHYALPPPLDPTPTPTHSANICTHVHTHSITGTCTHAHTHSITNTAVPKHNICTSAHTHSITSGLANLSLHKISKGRGRAKSRQ